MLTLGTRRVVDGVLAGLVGLGGALLGVQVVDGRAEVTAVPPGDRVAGAVAALRESSVHVAPDGRHMLSEADEQALEELIADAPVPVHVLVWEPSSEAGGEPYSFSLPEQLASELGEPGVYVVWQGPEDAGVGVPEGERLGWDVPELVAAGDPATRLGEFVRGLPPSEVTIENENADYWGGTAGGVAAGLLMVAAPAALGSYLLTGLLRVATGRPFRNRPRPAATGAAARAAAVAGDRARARAGAKARARARTRATAARTKERRR